MTVRINLNCGFKETKINSEISRYTGHCPSQYSNSNDYRFNSHNADKGGGGSFGGGGGGHIFGDDYAEKVMRAAGIKGEIFHSGPKLVEAWTAYSAAKEARKAEEARKIAEEAAKQAAEEASRAAEEARRATEEAAKQEEERKAAEQRAEEARRAAEEASRAAEEAAKQAAEERKFEQQKEEYVKWKEWELNIKITEDIIKDYAKGKGIEMTGDFITQCPNMAAKIIGPAIKGVGIFLDLYRTPEQIEEMINEHEELLKELSNISPYDIRIKDYFDNKEAMHDAFIESMNELEYMYYYMHYIPPV